MMRISEILTRNKTPVLVQDDISYKQVTIRTNYKGVILRGIQDGTTIGTKNQFRVSAGQFILSRIDARNGAFGIVPAELEGAIVTNDFLAFDINEDKVDIDFFNAFLQSPNFLEACIKASRGNTNRKRVNEDFFLNYQINIPPYTEQHSIIKRINKARSAVEVVQQEIRHNEFLLVKMNQAVLLEAMRGGLTANWRATHLDLESADSLLDEIRAQKSRAVSSGKLRPDKPLPIISADEIPFGLPKGWQWCRFGDLCEYITSGSRGWQAHYADDGALFIRAQNIKTDRLKLDDLAYVRLPEDAEGKRARIKREDILVTITGGNLGKTALVEQDFDEAYVSQHVALTRLTDTRLAKWIHTALTTDGASRGHLMSFSRGDKPGLNLPNVRSTLIPIPPLAEQIAILDRVDSLMTRCRRLTIEIEQSRSRASLLLQAVLREAFATPSTEEPNRELSASKLF